ncbi:unnamed protein product, partial [Polarella glacialis]
HDEQNEAADAKDEASVAKAEEVEAEKAAAGAALVSVLGFGLMLAFLQRKHKAVQADQMSTMFMLNEERVKLFDTLKKLGKSGAISIYSQTDMPVGNEPLLGGEATSEFFSPSFSEVFHLNSNFRRVRLYNLQPGSTH